MEEKQSGDGPVIGLAVAERVVRAVPGLSPAQTGAVLAALRAAALPAPGRRLGQIMVEIAGYVGGALVLAAIGLALSQLREFGETAQTVLLAVVALAVAGAGVMIGGPGLAALRELGRDRSSPRRRLVCTLFALAACSAAFAAGVAAPERYAGLAVGAVGFLLAVAGYLLTPSMLGQAVLWGFSLVAIFEKLELFWPDDGIFGSYTTVVSHVVILGWCALWVWAAQAGLVREPYTAQALAAATATVKVHFLAEPADWRYALMGAVAVVCFVAFALVRNWVVLAVGVLGLTFTTVQVFERWLAGEWSVVGALLVAGATLLAGSGVGLWIERNREETTAPAGS